ncbi:MAG: hypothetical protein L3J35_11880 [Bacteroidales bacterium]|nr:hypothetical protein [Bacteroidales bacterium]
MIISIWIIFIVIAGTAFWFYYKKNKHKLKNAPKTKSKKNSTDYTLFDIDEMLKNITKKKIENPQNIVSIDFAKNEKDEVSQNEKTKKQPIDFKNEIVSSIILKKKENL